MAQSCPQKKKKEDLNLNSFLHEMRDGSTGKDLPIKPDDSDLTWENEQGSDLHTLFTCTHNR